MSEIFSISQKKFREFCNHLIFSAKLVIFICNNLIFSDKISKYLFNFKECSISL